MLAKIKNIADEKDISFSLERVGLDPDSDKKVKKFSLGMKQRLNIAQAIFENQKIILLDEPTNALDEEAVQLIYKIIREEKSLSVAAGSQVMEILKMQLLKVKPLWQKIIMNIQIKIPYFIVIFLVMKFLQM